MNSVSSLGRVKINSNSNIFCALCVHVYVNVIFFLKKKRKV